MLAYNALRRFCRLLLLIPATASAQLPEAWRTIYLDGQASSEVRAAVEVLSDRLEQDFGERPRLLRAALWPARSGIHIASRPDHPAFDPSPLVDELLLTHDAGRWQILGKDNPGTAMAVYRFIEACLGWYYFQPGPLGLAKTPNAWGTDSPAAAPARWQLHERAGFISRDLSGLDTRAVPNWAQWNRLRERFSYNHSLHRLIPPALFETHPHWFAKNERGQPMRPPFAYPSGYNDHPDLTEPEVEAWHAAQVIRALDAGTPFLAREADQLPELQASGHPRLLSSPGSVSVSLGLADSYIFGHLPPNHPLAPTSWFRRWQDWSPLVFAHSNAVAERVTAAWEAGSWSSGPRKPLLTFGVLAYLLWENTPGFAVHPAILPVLTYDRSQWYDPAGRADDLATVERWAALGTRFLATWDYLFGYGYLIPRSLVGVIAESIPSLRDRGVDAYFAQVSSAPPYDGHTTWLLTRLLWDPDADPQALLDFYFTYYHGPAAPHLKRFFELAEQTWMHQPGTHGWWLRYWMDPWQAALYPPGKPQPRSAMREALAAAQAAAIAEPTPLWQQRLEPIQLAFSLTEKFIDQQHALWQLQQLLGTASTGADRVESAAAEAVASHLAFRAQLDAVRTAGIRQLTAGDWFFRHHALEQLLFVAAQRFPDRPVWASLQARLPNAGGIDFATSFAPAKNVLADTRFAKIADPRVWREQSIPAEGLQIEAHPDGGAVVRNARRSSLFQLFRAEPGASFIAELDLATEQSPSGQVALQISFFDKAFQPLTESPRTRIAPTGLYGTQQRLFSAITAPPGAAYGRVFIRFYELDPGQPVHLRAVQVLRMDPPASP